MDVEWWKNAVIYQVYLPSFKDSNNDGIGDFQGLISKLDYFDYLGIDTIMMSPFYPSPMHDNGYDIACYTEVDPRYGTMEDFDNFMKAIKEHGLNIILDLPINHTSNEHEWFLASVRAEEPYKDYYMWVEPKYTQSDALPPNNWVSVFGGSAWEWNPQREKFYLHQFLPEQPDLNLRNPDVRNEIKDIFKFWLDKGVGGFRIDAASHLFEDEELRDEPIRNPKASSDEYKYLDHIYTKGQKESLKLIQEWRDLLSEYQDKSGKHKLLLVEVTESVDENICYYGDSEKPLADIPFNFALTQLHSSSTARDLHKAITSWTDAAPAGKIPNWILGNHDLPRLASNVGTDLINGLHMVVLLLPGVVFCYYGDEIGMENVIIDEKDMKDSFALRTKPENSRDPSRTPMQWNGEVNAGFTNHDIPWLPIHENYKAINVEAEKSDMFSVLETYRKLLVIRKEPSISRGYAVYPVIDGNIFSMVRLHEGDKGFLVILNMGKCCCLVDFSQTCEDLPGEAFVEITNNRYLQSECDCPDTEELHALYKKYSTAIKLEDKHKWKFLLNNLFLLPKEAMVLSFFPPNKS